MQSLIKEKIVYTLKDNALFITTWVFALSTVILMNMFNSQSFSFVGVTDSKEVNLNLKHAVLIKKIHVLPGQYVTKGQILAELERPDLEKQMNEVSHKLEELHNQLSLNETLTNSLKSIKEKNRDIDNGLTIQIRSLENQLDFLRKEEQELYIYAQFDGHIGFVNYKNGESVSPFAPIITMHQRRPTFVRGYVHESIINKIQIGSQVKISSLNGSVSTQAQVTSVGNRIIEFPERFRRSLNEKIWGREVGIKLSLKNKFLLGEKVFLELLPGQGPSLSEKRTLATKTEDQKALRYHKIGIPAAIKERNRVELSGIVYLEDLDSYLVVSDDTYKDRPYVYRLNNSGDIDSKIYKIDGLKGIKDMEALTNDEEGNLYVISSQSENSKGEIPKERRRLVRFSREGEELKEDKKVDLLTAMDAYAKLYPEDAWVSLVQKKNLIESKYSIELDIEGIFVREDTLYVGLRHTFTTNDEVVILKIEGLQNLLEDDTLAEGTVSVWKKINLPKSDNKQGISDLFIHENIVYMVTADNTENDNGRLFKFNFNDSDTNVILMETFVDHRPEGITLNTKANELVVVFDNNKSKKAYMTKVAL